VRPTTTGAGRPFRTATAGSVTALAVLVAGLAGCGGATPGNGEAAKSAEQIYKDASASTAALPSLKVSGTLVSGENTLALDLDAGRSSGGGTLTIDGSPLEVVVDGTALYLKGADEAWDKLTGSSAAGAALGGKWLQTETTDQGFGNLAALVNVSKLVTSFKPEGAVAKSKPGHYEGHPAIGVVDKGGSRGTLYVATTGKPYILGITGDGDGNIDFGDYGTATIPAAPTHAEPLTQAEHQAGA
jgi:hypothetical protein